MAAEHTTPHVEPVISLSTAGRRAELVLSGEIGAAALPELEQRVDAPALAGTTEWVVDMSGVTRLDLACAYALLRVATRTERPPAVTVRGARRAVRRTLHHAGLTAVATITE
ncbi:STAS domain-containing protein [Streptomyces spongiicola]|uniref:STAS domain-containing protein n=1 Tax=Streptomyces spongiicola TaxID=1690221 RepID=UPI00142D77FA|nr:STAS domain-containing protein [Streptomyces spongiicola]